MLLARAQAEEEKRAAAHKEALIAQDVERRRLKAIEVEQSHILSISNEDVLSMVPPFFLGKYTDRAFH